MYTRQVGQLLVIFECVVSKLSKQPIRGAVGDLRAKLTRIAPLP